MAKPRIQKMVHARPFVFWILRKCGCIVFDKDPYMAGLELEKSAAVQRYENAVRLSNNTQDQLAAANRRIRELEAEKTQ